MARGEGVRRHAVALAGLGLAAAALGACTLQGRARAFVEPPTVSTVELTSAPIVEYRSYPHTVYEGRTVYLIDNRWGYPSGDSWVFYREEPAPLARYRTTIEAAPPAPRSHVRPETRPPVHRRLPPVSAPPATRTR
jgi:hypothetical protein